MYYIEKITVRLWPHPHQSKLLTYLLSLCADLCSYRAERCTYSSYRLRIWFVNYCVRTWSHPHLSCACTLTSEQALYCMLWIVSSYYPLSCYECYFCHHTAACCSQRLTTRRLTWGCCRRKVAWGPVSPSRRKVQSEWWGWGVYQ